MIINQFKSNFNRKRQYYLLPLLVVVFFLKSCNTPEKETKQVEISNRGYVNPFIGTGGHGHTYPGATVPFGMLQVSPDNGISKWDWCSGYHYSDSIIIGFSHLHLSGTGIGDLADIRLMPIHKKVDLNTYLDYTYEQISLEKAYSFNPVPADFSKEEAALILGLGTQMWGEWTPTAKEVYSQTFPRIAAYAETGWTQRNNKNYTRFNASLPTLFNRWEKAGILESHQENISDK